MAILCLREVGREEDGLDALDGQRLPRDLARGLEDAPVHGGTHTREEQDLTCPGSAGLGCEPCVCVWRTSSVGSCGCQNS